MRAEPSEPAPVPRGRHAPPLEVRLDVQRRRLFTAAAAVFARVGYAEASAESISREAGMSKATFYEHFANKEECLLALFEFGAGEVGRNIATASARREPAADYPSRVRGNLRAFLQTLARYPDSAQTLLVEMIGAGPRAAQRRETVLVAFAREMVRANAEHAPKDGWPVFASEDDAYAVVGAIAELVARHLRAGDADLVALVPVLERLVLGVLLAGAREAA